MRLKQEMDKIKVESYKDCVWYLENIDKCKMPSVDDNVSECYCKEEMNEFCVWLTKFFNAIPEEPEDNKVSEITEYKLSDSSSFTNRCKRFVNNLFV